MTRIVPFLILTAAACSARAEVKTEPFTTVPLTSLISQEDYPAAALRNEEQGTVGFRLNVGNDGRVQSCSIVTSSGSASLDSATCRIMASRARFTPATNDKGEAVDGSVQSRIAWRITPASVGTTPAGVQNPRLNAANSLWAVCVNGETAKRAITKQSVKNILEASYASCKANEALAISEFKRAGLPDAAISAAMAGLKRPLEANLPKAMNDVRATLGIAPDTD